MVDKQTLWEYVLSKVSLEYNLYRFLEYLRCIPIEFDANKKYLKLYHDSFVLMSCDDFILDIELLKAILSKKLHCSKEDLTITVSSRKKDCPLNIDFRSDIDTLIKVQTKKEFWDYPEMILLKLKYDFLQEVSIIMWGHMVFTTNDWKILIKVWLHIFNWFNSVFTQLIVKKKTPDVIKKYKTWILIIWAVCLFLNYMPVWIPIYVELLKSYYNGLKDGKHWSEWLERKLTKKWDKKDTITESDCRAANTIFIGCWLKYRFDITEWILNIIVKD